MKYQEIEGDLIIEAKKGNFDVIAHGCNCFCNMGAGIAVAMKNTFGCNLFKLELTEIDEFDGDEHWKVSTGYKGDINKLGQIDYVTKYINLNTNKVLSGVSLPKPNYIKDLIIVNCYTQYSYGSPKGDLDYEALILCMRKINAKFAGKHIGLPQIGAGLAKGNWQTIKETIQRELQDMNVTIIIYKNEISFQI